MSRPFVGFEIKPAVHYNDPSGDPVSESFWSLEEAQGVAEEFCTTVVWALYGLRYDIDSRLYLPEHVTDRDTKDDAAALLLAFNPAVSLTPHFDGVRT